MDEPVVFKRDARSCVELMEDADGGRVVRKRYLHGRFKQRWTYRLGVHPGQKERRAAAWLERIGVPVVAVMEVSRSGGEVTVVTRWHGPSLDVALAEAGGAAGAADRARLLSAAGALAERLIERRVFFKDLKASNVVLGPGWPGAVDARLIDVGSARRGLSGAQRRRMVGMLRATCEAAGAEPGEVAAALPAAD
ncbi:MAG: hypothetical protein AAF823_12135 [Planctomycetota bacterium]